MTDKKCTGLRCAVTAINLCDLKAENGDLRIQKIPVKLLPVETITKKSFHLKHFKWGKMKENLEYFICIA